MTTSFDPWADVPKEEKPVPEAVQAEVRPNVLPEGADEVVVTLKGGSAFSDPWIVIHAQNIESALDHLSDTRLAGLMEKVKKASSYFVGGKAPSPVTVPAQGPLTTSTPAVPVSNGGSDAHYCAHGAMEYKQGVKRETGKAWKGYFCPEKVCSPVWPK